MKITTKKIDATKYEVYKDGVFTGTMWGLASGDWEAYDKDDNWLGTTHTKKYCLKWCF